MHKIEASTQKSILNELNKASEFFRHTMQDQDISLNLTRWKIISGFVESGAFILSFTTYLEELPISRLDDLPYFKSTHCTGAFSSDTYISKPSLNYLIKCRGLLENIIGDAQKILNILTPVVFQRKILFNEFENLLKKTRVKTIPYLDTLSVAVKNWMFEATLDTSSHFGRQLYKATEYFPQFRHSPFNVLYRCIIVAEPLFIKAQTKGKSLILKKRTYSSWTYDLNSAKRFGKSKSHIFFKDFILVIFRKKFTDENIACNILEAGTYLHKYGKLKTTLTKKEKEIVVRNPQDNFIFKPEDIYLYAPIVKGHSLKWQPF
jgi:hypothetical protein